MVTLGAVPCDPGRANDEVELEFKFELEANSGIWRLYNPGYTSVGVDRFVGVLRVGVDTVVV